MPVLLLTVSPVRFHCGKLRVRPRNQNRRSRTRKTRVTRVTSQLTLFHALHRRRRMEMQVFVSRRGEDPSSSERQRLLSSSIPQNDQLNRNSPPSDSQVPFPASSQSRPTEIYAEGCCRLLCMERSGITGSSFFLASVASALHSESLSCSHPPSDFDSERPCHF